MFPLDVLSQTVPSYQVAGRFGVEVMGLFYPRRAAVEPESNRLIPRAELTGLIDLPTRFEQSVRSPISRAALHDQALACRPQGEFFSTDELSGVQIRRDQDQCLIELVLTRHENPDGEAAPRDLYLMLYVEEGNRPLRRLELQFRGRWRDFRGNEIALTEPVAVTQLIEVTD
jgi:hypothetical protein